MLWRWLWSVWRVKGIFYNQEKKPLSELAKANVEALASGETGGSKCEFPDAYAQTFECGGKVGVFQYCKAMIIVCQGGGHGCNSRRCPVHG